MNDTPLAQLSHRQYRRLLIISELYRQQHEMFEEKKNTIEHRIVSMSIDQPQKINNFNERYTLNIGPLSDEDAPLVAGIKMYFEISANIEELESD